MPVKTELFYPTDRPSYQYAPAPTPRTFAVRLFDPAGRELAYCLPDVSDNLHTFDPPRFWDRDMALSLRDPTGAEVRLMRELVEVAAKHDPLLSARLLAALEG